MTLYIFHQFNISSHWNLNNFPFLQFQGNFHHTSEAEIMTQCQPMGTCSGKCQSHSNCVAIKLQTCTSHSMIQGCGGWVIYVNKQFYCDFKDLKYSVWICIQIFVLTSNCLYMHDSHQVGWRSTEQVISMVTTSKTAIAHKLLSVQEQMNIINVGGMKLKISLTKKKSLKNSAFQCCVNLEYETWYSVCMWEAKLKKVERMNHSMWQNIRIK